MNDALQDLLARDAIRDLVLRYSRAVDRRDFDSLRPLYCDNAIDDHGAMFNGSATEFINWLPSMAASMKVLSHQVLNHLIAVRGDNAEGEVYTIAYHLTVDEQEIVIGGRYLDRYRRDDGVWRFAARKIVLDWHQQGAPAAPDSPVTQGVSRGAALADDPSADFFQFLDRR